MTTSSAAVVAVSSLSGKPQPGCCEPRQSAPQLARYPEAIEDYDQAVGLADASGNLLYEIVTRASRADVFVSIGQPEIAAREMRELAPLIDKTIAADSTLMHRIMRVRVRVDAAQGRTPEALSRHSEVIAKPNITDAMLARVLAERSELYLKLGQTDLALADAQRDLEVARGLQRDKPYWPTPAARWRCWPVFSRRARRRTLHTRARPKQRSICRRRLVTIIPHTRWARQALAVACTAPRPYVSTRQRYSIGPTWKRLSHQRESGTWMTKKIATADHQVERRADLVPQLEAPVIEQRNRDQRLQQIVGERHAARERDRRDALAPSLVAHRANDRRHVEHHDRDPAHHIARRGEDAADRRFARDWRRVRQAMKPMPQIRPMPSAHHCARRTSGKCDATFWKKRCRPSSRPISTVGEELHVQAG